MERNRQPEWMICLGWKQAFEETCLLRTLISLFVTVKEISGDWFIPQCPTWDICPACFKQLGSFSALSECSKRNWNSCLLLYVTRLILELETIRSKWDSAMVITTLLRQQEAFWTTGLVMKEFWKADLGWCQIGFENPTIYSSKYAAAEIFLSNPSTSSARRNINIRQQSLDFVKE